MSSCSRLLSLEARKYSFKRSSSEAKLFVKEVPDELSGLKGMGSRESLSMSRREPLYAPPLIAGVLAWSISKSFSKLYLVPVNPNVLDMLYKLAG
ncbi:hypothetical protein OGATHE_001389 [Ogataea polymorpha]|uniref:Uncharacterized protein n=1 Tax=Ogataea polymorpha TaxID=460523 RepID=A0A9P8PT07_9ASCO|nr:hypothetical protein OGATHE_001389 [Ogataea polymorpha]